MLSRPPTTHLHALFRRGQPAPDRAGMQPWPLAGAAANAGVVKPLRLAQGRGPAAPPTLTVLPHAAPLHP